MLIAQDLEPNGRFLSPARQSLNHDSFLDQVERENQALESELQAMSTPERQYHRQAKSTDKHNLRHIRAEMDEFQRELLESEGPDPISFKLTGRSLTPGHFKGSKSMYEPAKSLEMRLKAATEAVNSLTKLLKDKERKVTELQAELEHKDRSFQLLQSQSVAASGYQKSISVQSASVSLLKSREKDLEMKVKSQEVKINEDKRTLFRLQEVNKKLIARIKASELHIQATTKQLNPAKVKKIRALEEENQQLYLQNRQMKAELSALDATLERERAKYADLQRNAVDFEARTRDLYRANQLLNQNLVKVMNAQ